MNWYKYEHLTEWLVNACREGKNILTIKYLYLVLRISVCGVSLIKKNDSNSFYEHPAV